MSSAASTRAATACPARSHRLFQHREVAVRPARTLAPRAVPWWSNKYEAKEAVVEKASYGNEGNVKGAPFEGQKEMTAEVETLGKNKFVVETLARKLPERRAQVTADRLLQMQTVTGFSGSQIFSKFLWYVLKDRNFDEAAVADLAHLKQELKLSSADVAQALRERCNRIEKKFGNLILPPGGITEKVLQQKAQGRAFFSKMLYLTESDLLEGCDALPAEDVHAIFGATEEDVEQLRIVELQVPEVKQKQKQKQKQRGLFGIF